MSGSAREEILARIKAATAATGDRDAVAAWDETRPVSVRPELPGDIAAYFRAKAEANQISVQELPGLDRVPAAVALILAGANLPPDICVAPALRGLPWPSTMEVRSAKARIDEKLTVTQAVAAIAETGSVVLCSGDEGPSSLNYAAEIHVVVLDPADIMPYLEDGLAKVKAACDPWPRAVNVVSGPSRTADVAGIVVRPAHGPKSVHLLITSSR
ncbi:MAG TPA: LUD domain-containing protein [Hyphomicrobium sp.]|nr:LUD domain-containing protein [Hyphomicrobium sp.]